MTDFLEIGIAYLGISIAGMLAYRFRQSLIPAYILIGMLIGPFGIGLVKNKGLIEDISTFGIIFLLLFLGLEFSVKRLMSAGKPIGVGGTLDLLINFPLGFVTGLLLGWSILESLLLGGIIYSSSSAIVTKALIDLKRLANRETEVILGIMIYEDIAVAVFLAFVSGVMKAGSIDAGEIAISVGKAFLFFFTLVIIARKFNVFVTKTLNINSEELFLLFIFSLVILTSVAAESFGMSKAIGAFLIGLVFAETPHLQRIKTHIIPLRDVFASMFFFFFGMLIDFRSIQGLAFALFLISIVSIFGKMLTGIIIARSCGMTAKEGFSIGTGTLPRGEFSLILSSIGAAAGLTSVLVPLTGAYVLVISFLGLLMMHKSDKIYGFSRLIKRYVARQ